MFREGHSYKLKPEYRFEFKNVLFWRKHGVDNVVKVSSVLHGNAYFIDDSGRYMIASGCDFKCFDEVLTQEAALKCVF